MSTYEYPDLLKLLEGLPMKLPTKGSHSIREDNPLIIMNSNLPLKEHIKLKFKKPVLIKQSIQNLSTRVTELKIPRGKTLFLINYLIKKKLIRN